MQESLYYKEGSSDKVYQVAIENEGTGYIVTFAYGRRGSALTTGRKTTSPITLEGATKIFHKLVNEKKAKGYMSGTAIAGYTTSDINIKVDILPQLLNSISREETNDLLDNDLFYMQQKMDGQRVMIQIAPKMIVAINRRGMTMDIPVEVNIAVSKIHRYKPVVVLDGELVGECFYAFDIIDDSMSYIERYKELIQLTSYVSYNFQIVYAAINRKAKHKAFANFLDAEVEGVVFKDMNSLYKAGKPNSGGSHLKFKFYETCSAVVHSINVQRSVNLMIEGTRVGAVTILPNFEIPEVRTVVEVRYLYYNKGGALYQPLYLGERVDILPEECKLSQLKEKQETT